MRRRRRRRAKEMTRECEMSHLSAAHVNQRMAIIAPLAIQWRRRRRRRKKSEIVRP